ncbi:MAG: response regulator [Myxococcota bacterium]
MRFPSTENGAGREDVISLLIIEDDDLDANLLSRTIHQIDVQAFRTERVASLGQAHRLLDASRFDAILLDLSLPDATGFEAIESVVRDRVSLPIIVLTGLDDAALGQMLIRMGAQDYLPKAELTRDSIWRSISHALERHSLSQALVQAESRALSACSAKSHFVETMSHEIRTPLHAILGTADLLSQTNLDSQQAEYVDTFKRSGKALSSLVNDVLDFSAIDEGSIESHEEFFDPVSVLGNVLGDFDTPARNKGILLKASVSNDLPRRCVGDPERFRQVLANLVGNALKFTDAGEVRTKLDLGPSHRLRFSIEDTGCGIPSAEYGLVFERFRQGSSSVHRRLGGTGIGLAICKLLVEMMGGEISVSTSPEGGCRIVFEITALWETDPSPKVSDRADRLSPVAEWLSEELPRPARRPAVERTARGGAVLEAEVQARGACGEVAGLRILLVDDSQDNRMLATAYLTELNAEIEIAENGADAIRRYSDSGPYSVILMDMQMPLIDGYEATREIRRIESRSDCVRTPIVALTADAFEEQREESARAGCDEHLAKPISREKLVSAVTRLVPKAVPGPMDPPLVDPLIADLVPGFVARRFEDLELLEAALKKSRFEEIRRIAHKMKGSGSSFGFPMISDLGLALEEAAIAQDEKEIKRCFNQIREQLEMFEDFSSAPSDR